MKQQNNTKKIFSCEGLWRLMAISSWMVYIMKALVFCSLCLFIALCAYKAVTYCYSMNTYVVCFSEHRFHTPNTSLRFRDNPINLYIKTCNYCEWCAMTFAICCMVFHKKLAGFFPVQISKWNTFSKWKTVRNTQNFSLSSLATTSYPLQEYFINPDDVSLLGMGCICS